MCCQYCELKEVEGDHHRIIEKKRVSGRQVTLWRIESSIFERYRITIEEPRPKTSAHYTKSKDGRYHKKYDSEQSMKSKAEKIFANINPRTLKMILDLWKKQEEYYKTKALVAMALRNECPKVRCGFCGHSLGVQKA